MESEHKAMTNKELSAAVQRLLELEEKRGIERDRRRQRAARERKELREAQVNQLYRSIELIKWCLVAITTAIVVSLIAVLIIVSQLRAEAERIQGEVERIRGEAEVIVEQIESEAQQIRDKLQNPIRTLGGALGGQLDRRISDAIA